MGVGAECVGVAGGIDPSNGGVVQFPQGVREGLLSGTFEQRPEAGHEQARGMSGWTLLCWDSNSEAHCWVGLVCPRAVRRKPCSGSSVSEREGSWGSQEAGAASRTGPWGLWGGSGYCSCY